MQPVETVSPVIPDSLVTPRAMKSVVKGGGAAVPPPDVPPSSNDAVEPREQKPNLKRPAPVEEIDDTAIARTAPIGAASVAQAPSKPPPKKRPKAAPSLFIPKNKVSLQNHVLFFDDAQIVTARSTMTERFMTHLSITLHQSPTI